MKLHSVELFSGCGGLAYGLSLAGFSHQAMVEWDADAVATVHHNRSRRIKLIGHWPLERADVRTMDWTKFSGDVSLVAGGPPCQPFSIGGKHRGKDDGRDMWPEAIRAVHEIGPEAFLFENVRGIARPVFSSYLNSIVTNLAGYEERKNPKFRKPRAYDVVVLRVNAADFGAAQKRHRVIIAGIRKDVPTKLVEPTPTHSRERLLWEQWVTGSYWRRHGLSQPDDNQIPRADLSVVLKLRQSASAPALKPWRTVRDALEGLGLPNGKKNHTFQPGARTYPGHTGSPLDEPSKALKAGDHGVPGGENMMVLDDGSVRYFTVREAARLQGLPDTYEFPRSWSESMRQLGNAVPTQLAEAMGSWIKAYLVDGFKRDIRAA